MDEKIEWVTCRQCSFRWQRVVSAGDDWACVSCSATNETADRKPNILPWRGWLLEEITAAYNAKIISASEIYQHLSTLGDVGATPEEIKAVEDEYCDDDINVDEGAWASRADEGFWVHGWLWIATPEVMEDDNVSESE